MSADETPSVVYDHPYVPRRAERADWDLCWVCGLSIAAHERRASPEEEAAMRAPAFTVERYGAVHSWTREPVRRWSFRRFIRGLGGA